MSNMKRASARRKPVVIGNLIRSGPARSAWQGLMMTVQQETDTELDEVRCQKIAKEIDAIGNKGNSIQAAQDALSKASVTPNAYSKSYDAYWKFALRLSAQARAKPRADAEPEVSGPMARSEPVGVTRPEDYYWTTAAEK